MTALIALTCFILISCLIPTQANGEAGVKILNCTLAEMDVELSEEFFNNTLPEFWNGVPFGFFVDDADPSCAKTALDLFYKVMNTPPYEVEVNFTNCGINITKIYGQNHELEKYIVFVNGRITKLTDPGDMSSQDPTSHNVTVPLYYSWEAEATVSSNSSVHIDPTQIPPIISNSSATDQLSMNITTGGVVYEGDRIRVSILLNRKDADDVYVAERPMECTISNADRPSDPSLYLVYNGCPYNNINQLVPSLHFDAFKKNDCDYYFDFDAFTYNEESTSNLFIQCRVLTCIEPTDCDSTSCWSASPSDKVLPPKITHGSRGQSMAQDKTETMVHGILHVQPRSTGAPSPSTSHAPPSSTLNSQVPSQPNLTVLYIILGALLLLAIILGGISAICLMSHRSSRSRKRHIPRYPRGLPRY